MSSSEKRRKIDQIRFKALYDLSKMINDSRQDILDFALEAGVEVTGSEIGYIYLCNDDETELELHAWSRNVMPRCRIKSYPEKYLVSDTGLWGEAVRQRCPVITNTYSKSPYKKGYPKGHVPVKRHMNLPVFDNEKIVMITGVGNKKNPYNDEDVRQLSILMDGMWNILKRKQTEEELKRINAQLKQDLIERKRLEIELKQAYKMESLGTMAGGIAHDFNNILASIIGYTELTISDMEEASAAYDNLNQILAAGFRAKEIVKQILTFSRYEEKEPKPVLLKPIVKEVLKLIRISLPSIIQVEHSIKGNPLIMASHTQIYQVMMNLCTNAGHAMGEKGGTLTVEVENTEITDKDIPSGKKMPPGPYVRIIVSDTGCGMTHELQQKIFDPFFTTKARGTGTGMGLSVVHGIVSSFGGIIDLYSKPGEGTCFKLLFPAVERRDDFEKRLEEPLPGGSEHIFFVDDEEPIVQLNTRFLRSLGYKVSYSTSSIEALKMFKEKGRDFDLAILDTDMPHMTGLQLSEQIIHMRPDIPIILYSGFISKQHSARAQEIGIKVYLSKPVLTRELARTIRHIL